MISRIAYYVASLFDRLRPKSNQSINLPKFEYKKLVVPEIGKLCNHEKMVDVSVIMPVYNVEDVVVNAIESVVNQETTFSFELIIINDASTDSSLEKINPYQDNKRVKIIDLDTNCGLSNARNVGIDLSKGEYITFIDSDDIMIADALQYFMLTAKELNSDLVCARHISFVGDDDMDLKKINRENIITALDLNDSHRQVSGFAWGKLFHHKLFDKVRFPVGIAFEDIIILPLLVCAARNCVISSNSVIAYRDRKKSLSKRTSITMHNYGLDHIEGLIYVMTDNNKTEFGNSLFINTYFLDQITVTLKSRSYYMRYEELAYYLGLIHQVIINCSYVSAISEIDNYLLKAIETQRVYAWRVLSKIKRNENNRMYKKH